MKLHLFCYVNETSIEKVKQAALRCCAKFVDKELIPASKDIFKNEKFKVLDNLDFVSMEFVFDNLFDINQFCYQVYMACGYHFFIENIVFIP